MRKLITIIFLFVTFQINATNYYVSNTGSNSNDGTSDTTPWLTIAKVNAMTFTAGDQILFKKGDTWREILTIPSSGTSGNPILFGSYGTGNKPRILGSNIETSWVNISGNIWESTSTYTDPYAMQYDGNIYFIETNGNVSWGRVKKANTGACIAEYDWTWATNHIYIYSPTDPNTRYSGVEVSQRRETITLNEKNYLSFDGLEIAYSGSWGIKDITYSNFIGLTVQNCLIHHIGIKSSLAAFGIEQWHSNALIKNNIIHDCGRRGLSMYVWGTNAQNVHDIIVEDNTFYNGFHTTGVDMSSQDAGSLTNVIVRRNLMYNELYGAIDGVENYASAFIYCSRDGSGDVGNIQIYNNVFKSTTSSAVVLGGGIGSASSSYVYNNTFYGVSTFNTQTSRGFITGQNGINTVIKNNIFYNDALLENTTYFTPISFESTSGTVVLDNNLYYNIEGTRLIRYNGTSYSVSQYATYKSASGQDAHSIISQNPNFISSSDYNLQSNSLAINAGVDVGLTTDYLGHSISGLPDIGAYEYFVSEPEIPIIKKGILAGEGKAWGIGGVPYGL